MPSTDWDYYVDSNDKVIIFGYIGPIGGAIVPSTIDGYPVDKIIKDDPGVYDNLTSIVIPSSVTSVAANCFNSCTRLTSATFLGSSTTLGYYVFSGCTNLSNVTLPSALTNIPTNTFKNCISLETVTIPETVTRIYGSAFENSGISNIIIPNSVTGISDYAFRSCNSLTSINIPASVTSIGQEVFAACSNLTSITVDAGNTIFTSDDGILFYIATSGLLLQCYPAGKASDSFTTPNGVTSINIGAFNGCTNLNYITITDEVTYISKNAFYGCSGLINIVIPETVFYVGQNAFYGCTNLSTITFMSATTTIYDDTYTIPSTTTIAGYDPSTAKTYADTYSKTFDTFDYLPRIDKPQWAGYCLTWEDVDDASSYRVTLYQGGTATSTVTVAPGKQMCDLTNVFTAGTFTATVQARGEAIT